MKRHPILAAALLAALSFAAAPAHASAGGTVTLDGFSYTLTDLDPNDGVSPSLTLLPPSGAEGDAAFVKLEWESGAMAPILTTQSVDGAPISLVRTWSPSTSLSASASGLSSLATTSLSASAHADEANYGYYGSMFSAAWGDKQAFVLSPHTELSLIATAHYTGQLVPSGVDEFSLSAEIRLDGTGPDGRYFLDDFSAKGYGSGYNPGPVSIDRILHVVGVYANDSDASLAGTLQMVAGAEATAFDWVPPPVTTPVTTPVPEPAELAMLAAGLPLLLALRRGLRPGGRV